MLLKVEIFAINVVGVVLGGGSLATVDGMGRVEGIQSESELSAIYVWPAQVRLCWKSSREELAVTRFEYVWLER
jgi:hypothetical protein